MDDIQALLGEQNALETFKGLRKKDIVFGKIDDASPSTSNENDNALFFSLGESQTPKKHRKNCKLLCFILCHKTFNIFCFP